MTKRIQEDLELETMRMSNKLMDEIHDRFIKLQTKGGVVARKRAARWLLARHSGLMDWLREL